MFNKVDTFLSYDEACHVRDVALGKKYSTHSIQGWDYENVSPAEKLDFVHGSLTDLLEYEPNVKLSFYRRELRGELHKHRIHVDNSISEYSGVLFLTPDNYCRGGISFWNPNKPYIKGKVDPEKIAAYYNKISTDTRLWNFADFAEMKFGRFVWFDTGNFHSQFPLESWGEEFYGGRLTLNLFWDTPNEYIHELRPDEVPQLMDLAVQFYSEGDLPGKMIPEYFVERWKHIITSGTGFILAHKIKINGKQVSTGFIGGVISPALSDGVLECNEGFWYADRKHRGYGVKLFEKFEAKAVAYGAKRIDMAHLDNGIGKVVARFYRSRGYERIESHFYKVVGD